MLDRHILEQKLASLAARLARIEARLPGRRDVFLADTDAQESVAFNLFVAFQDAMDLAAHLIATRNWEMPGTAREHFDILARHHVLARDTAGAMGRCAGLRSLIVHAYGTLDLGRLYDEIPAGRAALEALSAEVAAAI